VFLFLQIDPKVAFPRRAHPKVSFLIIFFSKKVGLKPLWQRLNTVRGQFTLSLLFGRIKIIITDLICL